jgi:hypothetical protein
MLHEATCPKGHRLQVADAHVGQRVNCPACGETFAATEANLRPKSSTPPQLSPKVAIDPRRWKSPTEPVPHVWPSWTAVGRPLIAFGLMLTLVSRGCDAISRRGVDRAKAKLTVVQTQFSAQWQKKRAELDDKIAAAEAKEAKARDRNLLIDLRLQKADIADREDKEREKKKRSEWQELDTAARNAEANYQINGYWREILFVFASMVLAGGLMVTSWTADGAHRWISLVMLAIIVLSVFVAGGRW